MFLTWVDERYASMQQFSLAHGYYESFGTSSNQARVNHHVHWFLRGKGLGAGANQPVHYSSLEARV